MARRGDLHESWRLAVGVALRQTREERGLSQEALAEGAGVDRKLVYRTELGQTSPRLDAFIALALGLDVEPSELLAKAAARLQP